MWESYTNEVSRCTLCQEYNLLEAETFPILQKIKPRNTDLLFVLEAPNHEDTHDLNKGYLTIDPETNPTGSFFYELFTEVLELDIEELFITNSVLCLPKEFASKYPITTIQRNLCASRLKQLIDSFNPKIVCTIGFQALKTLKEIDNHDFRTMDAAVGNRTDWYGRILFPLFHTGSLSRVSRSREEQVLDWENLKEIFSKKSIVDHNVATKYLLPTPNNLLSQDI